MQFCRSPQRHAGGSRQPAVTLAAVWCWLHVRRLHRPAYQRRVPDNDQCATCCGRNEPRTPTTDPSPPPSPRPPSPSPPWPPIPQGRPPAGWMGDCAPLRPRPLCSARHGTASVTLQDNQRRRVRQGRCMVEPPEQGLCCRHRRCIQVSRLDSPDVRCRCVAGRLIVVRQQADGPTPPKCPPTLCFPFPCSMTPPPTPPRVSPTSLPPPQAATARPSSTR